MHGVVSYYGPLVVVQKPSIIIDGHFLTTPRRRVLPPNLPLDALSLESYWSGRLIGAATWVDAIDTDTVLTAWLVSASRAGLGLNPWLPPTSTRWLTLDYPRDLRRIDSPRNVAVSCSMSRDWVNEWSFDLNRSVPFCRVHMIVSRIGRIRADEGGALAAATVTGLGVAPFDVHVDGGESPGDPAGDREPRHPSPSPYAMRASLLEE